MVRIRSIFKWEVLEADVPFRKSYTEPNYEQTSSHLIREGFGVFPHKH